MTSNLDIGENLIRNVGYAKDTLEAVNLNLLDSEIKQCLKIEGANPSWDDQDMGGHRLRNLGDVDSSSREGDAVNKKYVDDNLRTKFDAIAQPDLNMNNNAITNLASPFTAADAANIEYVDTYFVKKGGQEQCSWAVTKLKNLGAPTGDKDAASKVYVDQAPFLKLDGGQMAGAIDMYNNELVSLKDPVNPGDGVNKNNMLMRLN